MKNNTEFNNVPFIVMNETHGISERIKVYSVYNGNKHVESINYEKLKYLIDNHKIILINAYLEDGRAIFTDSYKYTIENKKKIYDVFKTNDISTFSGKQRTLTKILESTPFTIDIASTSSDSYGVISNPININGFNVSVKLVPDCDNELNIYFNIEYKRKHMEWWNFIDLSVAQIDTCSIYINETIHILKNIKNIDNITIEGLCTLSDFIMYKHIYKSTDIYKSPNWSSLHDSSENIDNIILTCNELNIVNDCATMFQSRIDNIKNYMHAIETFINAINTHTHLSAPSIDKLVLFFASHCRTEKSLIKYTNNLCSDNCDYEYEPIEYNVQFYINMFNEIIPGLEKLAKAFSLKI